MYLASTNYQRISDGLEHALRGLDDSAILRCFDLTLWFASRYASAYELPGSIYLVLDNSLIQALKHRQTNAKRAVDALAFETICAFVHDWSDRESHLALSPMAIFEHIGCACRIRSPRSRSSSPSCSNCWSPPAFASHRWVSRPQGVCSSALMTSSPTKLF